jgi:hypothetical protein
MARILRIGEPENASEQKAIRTLAAELPESWSIVHNFELTTGRGMPYEFDAVVIGDFAVWHVEIKGFRGVIEGDAQQWRFENGGVYPSPLPLANKKSKILASRLEKHSRRLAEVFVETCILLTDELVQVKVQDEQARKIVRLDQVAEHLTDPERLPVRPGDIRALRPLIEAALAGSAASHKVERIGLYDVITKINQTPTRTVFLARHRFIRTRPKNILKVYHFDIYSSDEEKQRQIEAIFHDQDAMRLLGAHPNLIVTGDMFAWDDNKFVLPTEFIEDGQTLEQMLARGAEDELSWARKAELAIKVARGLQHAHKHGVVHRDIRPLNVVVAPGGVVKLVNFDLALLESAPAFSAPKGLERRLDRGYCAPELVRDPQSATRRSDIYSLGVLLYRLITGQAPYADIEQALDAGRDPPLDLELLRSELTSSGSKDFMDSPEDAVGVITRMCRLDPAQRYADMDGVLEDLAILA